MRCNSPKTFSTVIAGLGSWHGDDQAGWKLVESFYKRPTSQARAVALQEPTELINHLKGCDRLVIVDACLSGASPGSIVRLQWPDIRIEQLRDESSHSYGIGSTLRLAERLGILPQRVVLFGIEVGQCQCMWKLSPAVERGLPQLRRKVLREVREAAHA